MINFLIKALIGLAGAIILVVAVNLVGDMAFSIKGPSDTMAPAAQMAEAEKEAEPAPEPEAAPAAEEAPAAAETPATGEAPTAAEAPAAEMAGAPAAGNAEAGVAVSRKCKACHTFEQGGKNKVGPNLFGVVGRPAASMEGFKYSSDFEAAAGTIGTWDPAKLNVYLQDPTQYLREATGNAGARSKMSFKLKDAADRADVIAYLGTLH